MAFDFPITSTKELSVLAKSKKLTTWLEVVNYVKSLPYGRNTNRTDVSLVLKEEKGSCSSKHAFLKALAIENSKKEIELILAIYKMNANNTSIGTTISKNNLEYIPEAHCYLKVLGNSLDVTSESSNFNNIKEAILSEEIILPNQVSVFKVNYHKEFIKKWIKEEQINFSFDKIWEIREECIRYLSQNS